MGHAFTGMGRAAKRGGLAVATLGVSVLVTRKCGVCGHPRSEHGREAGAARALAEEGGKFKPGWYPAGGEQRWWTGTAWGSATRPSETMDAPPEPDEAPSPAAPGVQLDPADIAQLAELHDAGALTDEEFAAAKRRLLGL
jgi:hypothetical protein